MKNKNNKLHNLVIPVVLLSAVASMGLAGCSFSESETFNTKESYSLGTQSTSTQGEANIGLNDDSYSDGISRQNIDQKLIYTGSLTIETLDYKESVADIQKTISKYDGYIESSETSKFDKANKQCDMVIKVPVDEYSKFMSAIEKTGNITSQSERVADVTNEYIDIKARLDSLNQKKNRLETLVESASNVDELLKIEESIQSTQQEIESATSQLKYLTTQTSYSTVYLTLSEVSAYQTESAGYLHRLGSTFVQSFSTFGVYLQELSLFCIIALPYLAFWGLIIFIICKIVKKIRRKKDVKPKTLKEAKKQKALKESNSEDLKPKKEPVQPYMEEDFIPGKIDEE